MSRTLSVLIAVCLMSGSIMAAEPLGTIAAWDKTFAGNAELPFGWVECNGQVLNMSASPFDGQTLPALNGQNRFLRGNVTTGNIGGSTNHHHSSTEGGSGGGYAASSGGWVNYPDHRHNNLSHIPPYYDVVWIIKVAGEPVTAPAVSIGGLSVLTLLILAIGSMVVTKQNRVSVS